MLVLAAVPALRLARVPAVPAGRVLALPADRAVLLDLVAVSKDASELRRWLYDLRYASITATGPCLPPPEWTPETSDRYLDFWRLHTSPATAIEGGWSWRIVPGQPVRPLALDEPPGLVEIAAQGDALLAAGRLRPALDAYTRAHLRAPSLALPLARCATCRLRLGDPQGAVVFAARALARTGASADLLDQLGDALAAAHQPARAAAAWEQAAGIDDGSATPSPAGRRAQRWLKAAEAMAGVRNTAAARAAARRALDREPGNRPARDLLTRLGHP